MATTKSNLFPSQTTKTGGVALTKYGGVSVSPGGEIPRGSVFISKSFGGSGGVSKPSYPNQEELAQQEAQRKQQVANQLQKEMSAEVLRLRQSYQRDVARASNRNQRLELLRKFQEDRGRAVALMQAKRVQEGIAERGTVNGINVTSSNVGDVISQLTGKEQKITETTKKTPFPGTQAYADLMKKTGQATKKYTPLEFLRETAKVPLKIIKGAGETAGGITESTLKKLGIGTYTTMTPEREIPQKVTVGGELKIPEQEIELFSPEIAGSLVKIGTQAGLYYTTPGIVLSPGFVVEGTETALNKKFSKAERLAGVAEAETGLLIGGLSFLNILKDLGVAGRKVNLNPEVKARITGKSAKVGRSGAKQKTVQVKKTKTAKKNVKELRDAIKREIKAGNKENVRIWANRQAKLILNNPNTSLEEKQLLMKQLSSVILEAETGTPILLERGLIDQRAFERAISRSKLFGKPKVASIKTPPSQVTSPKIVGGEGKYPSIFAGKGEYERTSFTTGSMLSNKIVVVNKQLERLNNMEATKQKNILIQIQRLKTRVKTATTPIQKSSLINQQKMLLRQLQLSKQNQKLNQRQLLNQVSLLRQRQNQIQKQKQKQKQLFKYAFSTSQIQKTRQRQKPRQRFGRAREGEQFKKKGLLKLPLTGIEPSPSKLKKPPKPFSGGGYSVFTRTKGKDVFFKKFKTKTIAERELKRRLGTTLRASGFITDLLGKRIKPRVSRGFRLSKTRRDVLVQRRKFRLGTRTERKEIQEARRKIFKPDNSMMSKRLKRRLKR